MVGVPPPPSQNPHWDFFAAEDQPRYISAKKKKKEVDYSKIWCCPFPYSQLTKAPGKISTTKSVIHQIIPKSTWIGFGQLPIGGTATLFNTYLLSPYSVWSTEPGTHFFKLASDSTIMLSWPMLSLHL